MEWVLMVDFYNSKTARDKALVEGMINLLLKRGFKPYHNAGRGGRELDLSKWNTWPFDIVWRKLLAKK